MKLFNTFNPDQEEALRQVSGILEKAFPPLGTLPEPERREEFKLRKRALELIIATRMLGKPYKWSERVRYQLGAGSIYSAGGFCIYWGKNKEGKLEALVHFRKDHKKGAVGGYMHPKERAYDGIYREGMEELRDAEGKPIINLDSAKYCLITSDYEQGDGVHASVHYTGYAYRLSDDEMTKLKAHIERCDDKNYAQAAIAASQGETLGLEFVSFDTIKDQTKFLRTDFTYWPHYKAYYKVALLAQQQIEKGSDPVGLGTPILRVDKLLSSGAYRAA